MNLFQKQQKTSRYNSIPDASADDDTAVPIDSTLLPPMWWMVVVVVAGMMLLTGCGTVWLLPDVGSSYTTTAEGLIVATEGNDDSCVPAGGTFSGTSTTTSDGEDGHFETCFQYGNVDKYCWTKSWFASDFGGGNWLQCDPDPRDGQWNSIDNDDMRYVNPPPLSPGDPYTCGSPCQGQHENKSF